MTPPNLILLHGSRGTHRELLPLAQSLTSCCAPILPDLLGHGGRPIPDRFSVEAMAQDIIAQMDRHGVERAYCFGYSFGGYVALYLARHAPQRILGAGTLATKVVFDAKTVALWTHLSDNGRVANRQKQVMDERHPGRDWTKLVDGLATLYRELGERPALTDADFAAITVPTLTIAASDDQIVPWGEALRLASAMPRGHAHTFSGKAHPLDVVPVPFLAGVIAAWLAAAAPRG